MTKKLKYEVIKEGDVFATGFKLLVRKNTPQSDLKKFVERFKDSPDFVKKFVVEVEEKENAGE